MNDATATPDKTKKFRSPPYPMYDLKGAVERTKKLFDKAQQYSVGVNTLAEAWGMKSGDGKVWRAAAALIQYGLLSDSGTGKTRKFQVTDAGKRIALDAVDSERRKEALRAAALAPMIHKELWGRFKTAKGLADSIVTTYLTLDREDAGEARYSPGAATEVLNTFRSSLTYAGITDSATVAPQVAVKSPEGATNGGPNPPNKIEVGDFVKWTSGGVDQFEARKVEWISEDRAHLRVIGSPTGIPMTEVTKAEVPGLSAPPAVEPVTAATTQEVKNSAADQGKIKNITTSVVGNRLQISADVSANEIDALKEMLTKYQEILKFLN
jgi:hypothetical protein